MLLLLSAAVKLAKPEPEIYQHAAQGLQTPPENILFLDDDCRCYDHLMITDLFAHKLISVFQRRLDLRVTRLARRQSYDLAYEQIGAHNRFPLEHRSHAP